MKLLKKLVCLVITLTMVLSCMPMGMNAVADTASALKPGLDIIILVDISNSNFPGISKNPYDSDMMCLDAAAMLINMCDSEYSRVAVVPFTDKVPESDWWNSWIDVSDPAKRDRLCDELYCANMVSQNNAKWHNGETKHTVALNAALDLMNNRQTNNPVLVVMLGDSDLHSSVNIDDCVMIADQIKSQNATIYCLDMGGGSKVEDKVLYRIASGEGDKEDYYWKDVTASDLKVRFSDIFADMIGSTRITELASIDGDDINFELYIPNRSVTEVNLVLDRSYLENSVFDLKWNDTAVSEDENLLIYSCVEPSEGHGSFSEKALTYDFISIKLINPEPGEWTITAKKGEEVDTNTQLSYDILYNYQIEPAVYDMADPYYQSETVTFTSNFVNTEDGSNSTDEALYRGNTDPEHPGIEAALTIYDANDNVVGTYIMTPDQQNLNFSYSLDLNTLGNIPGGMNEYSYEVNVRGDNMNKTSARASFKVENTNPKAADKSEIEWGERLEIVNIFDGGASGKLTIDNATLSSYFVDDDGDALSYAVVDAYGVKAAIDNNGVLSIEKADDEIHNDAYVTVRASDSAGQYADVKVNVKVLSVMSLVEECVSVTINVTSSGEGLNLVKGDTVTMSVDYIIEAPAGADKNAFPYSYLNDTITKEKLFANDNVAFQFAGDTDTIGFVDNGDGTCTLTIGEKDGATACVYVSTDIGALGNVITKDYTTETYVVKNADPEALDITEGFAAAGAMVTTDAAMQPVVYFEVDKDKPEESKLAFDISNWFTDADVVNGSDVFNYTVTVEPMEETSDIFSFARSLLRVVGLIEKDGPIVEVADVEASENADAESDVLVFELGENATLNFNAVRFGNAKVTVSASDGVTSVDQVFEYHITSSTDQLMCIIVYAVLLIILIVIIIVLINKLVIHRPWPGKRQPGFCVQLNGFDQMTMTGEQESKFLFKGRATKKLSDLSKNFYIADGGVSNSVFASILLWPTLGGNIVVEPSKKAKRTNAEVKVDGQPLGKKRKWTPNGTITVKYDDGMGNTYECVFKRR